MSASTIKMPDPIMDPITIAVELNKPRLCTSFGALEETAASELERFSGLVTYSKF
jgi:hypothetical protein